MKKLFVYADIGIPRRDIEMFAPSIDKWLE